MCCQPIVVSLTCNADHFCPGPSGQLDRDRADPACGARDSNRVTLLQSYGAHGRICGASGNGQRPGNLPRYVRWLARKVVRDDDDILGVAGAPVGETEDLVPDRDPFDAGADLGHDPGEVATLAGRETGRP